MKPIHLVLLIAILVVAIVNLLGTLGVLGGEASADGSGGAAGGKAWEYKVLAAADLEKMMIEILQEEEGIKPDEEGKMTIPREKMLSQNIMPRVMDKLGSEGWELTGINRADLYYFKRSQ